MRVPRLHFGSIGTASKSKDLPFVSGRGHFNVDHSARRQQQLINAPPTIDSLSFIESLRPKPSTFISNVRANPFSEDKEESAKDTFPEKLTISVPDMSSKSSEEEVIDSPLDNYDLETTTMSKKSSALQSPYGSEQELQSPYGSEQDYPEAKDDQELLMNNHLFAPNPVTAKPNKVYNSYKQFNPGQYQENSPEWQMAMLHYLIDMKMNGHKIQEVSVDEVIRILMCYINVVKIWQITWLLYASSFLVISYFLAFAHFTP